MEEQPTDKKDHTEVTLRPHGPLVVKGDFEVLDEDGKTLEKKPQLSFCRCRLSQKWPFCDGSHKAAMH
jgi:CDGSH-type Zn-finger protein